MLMFLFSLHFFLAISSEYLISFQTFDTSVSSTQSLYTTSFFSLTILVEYNSSPASNVEVFFSLYNPLTQSLSDIEIEEENSCTTGSDGTCTPEMMLISTEGSYQIQADAEDTSTLSQQFEVNEGFSSIDFTTTTQTTSVCIYLIFTITLKDSQGNIWKTDTNTWYEFSGSPNFDDNFDTFEGEITQGTDEIAILIYYPGTYVFTLDTDFMSADPITISANEDSLKILSISPTVSPI